ncbi:glycosyltransferase family 2 protein [Candidatus Peregrinibacteria bacterium]|nr:glycosyltransferase family 2 protein [Candidatus Peregrinibacteria bacterium]
MKNKISVIITAFKEEKTIGGVIQSVLNDVPEAEIIVVAPDDQTLNVARAYAKDWQQVIVMQDENKGKPAALNLAIKMANSDVVLFTDGDVLIPRNSLKLLASKLSPNTIATGKPTIIGDSKNMLNWWGETLFDVAHRLRLAAYQKHTKFLISGYLWGINSSVLKNIHLDENLLTEDEFITYFCDERKLNFVYVEKAEVGIKYPQSISDWLKQKVRTLGGSYQIRKSLAVRTRSLYQETSQAFKVIFSYPKTIQQWLWLMLLLFFRATAWIKAYFLIVILKKGKAVWTRVESTK